MRLISVCACCALLLAGCATTGVDGTGTAGSPGEPLPEAVAALAAPWQDLSSARLRPEDSCYWYDHVGPVETTPLPLRTPDGRPICRAAAE